MKRKPSLQYLIILLCLSGSLYAQSWSGIIDPSRAIDWMNPHPGVSGGIPNRTRQCGRTIAPYGTSSAPASPSTINNAIAACNGSNGYVLLGPGNFYLSSGITFVNSNNVTLRGSGADQTFIYFYAKGTCGLLANICLSSDYTNSQYVTNAANWTGTTEGGSGVYPKGATHLTLDNVTHLAVGGQIYLDQIDDDGTLTADGTSTVNWVSGSPFDTSWTGTLVIGAPPVKYTISSCNSTTSCTMTTPVPAQTAVQYGHDNGFFYVCSAGTFSKPSDSLCAGQGGGKGRGPSGRPGSRQQVQVSQVTAISGSGPYAVTVTPGLTLANWRSSQSPGAWWPNSSQVMHDNGVENLTADGTNSANCSNCANIVIYNARNNWVRGIKSVELNTNGGHPVAAHVWCYFCLFNTVRDSYFYGSDNWSQSYGIAHMMDTALLVENNIFQHVTAPLVGQGASTGSVLGYNFSVDDNYTAAGSANGWMDPSDTWHEVGESMNLYEGNSGLGLNADNIHGTHHLGTFFRNHYYGDLYNSPVKNSNTQMFQLQAYSRMFNAVGNVLGRTDGYYTTYDAHSPTAIFDTTGTGMRRTSYGPDAQTRATLLRWGNYDTVTGAARWCGNSSNTGYSTTCSSTSEIPTGLAQYANPVPTIGDTGAGQPGLPASFYLSRTPSWWVFPKGKAAPFPAIGPDVTGGSGPGGHSYTIPAENCWYNVMGGVLGQTSPVLYSFNADKCYSPPPNPNK
jgi:hypothetical protein